ncbi:putative glycosyl hydrolase [Bimuria novae-zelandiae CBS 107.79]|uniref:Putative glycosyl hydrolase n=1 Tax=Bimuria novae-zelandiae CBS 107.79 TaxID=1447943 RepID=A0A6A5UXB8_9PLEO|nr:putative glycosyl hydrolase [Bimuria novae-zelandiae CBS 107.79]
MQPLFLASLVSLWLLSLPSFVANAQLVSGPGHSAVIPWWKIGNSLHVGNVGNDSAALSDPDLDVSEWYSIGSKATLMAAYLENGARSFETELFRDENMKAYHEHLRPAFQEPWYYRSKFTLNINNRFGAYYYQLKTHGISSRADIYLNGALIADKNVQAGAYTGLTYNITSKARNGTNILLVRVYPTDYNRDFALGFVDWNPPPADNGTGIWRDVELKQTGSLSFAGPPRVNTKPYFDGDAAIVDVKVEVVNLGVQSVRGEVVCFVYDHKGKEQWAVKEGVSLAGHGTRKVVLGFLLRKPAYWYPKQWGLQPLYSTSCNVTTDLHLSDTTPKVRFGIRTVTSSLNPFNDTTFFINGEPFQVLGAGYTSDIFLRFDEEKVRAQFQYVLDMGLNTVRLEGKQEHDRLYELADDMGIMIMAGWECCDKWEGWSYNNEGSGEKWKDPDYAIANASMRHEAELMQHHPSILAFLIGSDFWPDDRATRMYVDALKSLDWDVPIIASASQRGFPALLGNGGMKMDGPYDWVPPNYWYTDQLGAAFGFGSELGTGAGTPELSSLKRFISSPYLDVLWKNLTVGLYHMSTNVSSFHTRTIYNNALSARFGPPRSLEDYLLKAQMMDYEATRAQFEAYAAKWSAERPATGLIYWMLNSAWPSLHWALFDYYLHPAGAYFGVKTGSRSQHVAYDYLSRSVYLINRSLAALGPCTVDMELLDLNGTVIGNAHTTTTQLSPNNSTRLFEINGIEKLKDVALLKLVLKNQAKVLSRNVYLLTPKLDTLDFKNSTWYHTPVTSYANFTALDTLPQVDLTAKAMVTNIQGLETTAKIRLQNKSVSPAVFIRLNLVFFNELVRLFSGEYEETTVEVAPVHWSDNYVTLWPGESLELETRFTYHGHYTFIRVHIDGWNVPKQRISIDMRGGKGSWIGGQMD